MTRPKYILVVDDSISFRAFVTAMLREKGYRVAEADSGKRAYELLCNVRFDLVVCDVVMENGSGLELRERMLARQDMLTIPFIVMTSRTDAETLRAFEGRGIAGYLTKPFIPGQLLFMVEKLLSNFDELLLKEQEALKVERSMLLGAISSLAQALDARDGYTRSHSESVARYAADIARYLGYPPSEVEIVHTAGQLHDIGKIGIPDAILQKPGKLTSEEYEQIKTHSTIGANILSSIPRLDKISLAVRHHHERWDGSGYPAGLEGEDIPVLARILSVADTFDALTSDRPYRKGFSTDKALEIVAELSGSQLCPLCSESFLTLVSRDAVKRPEGQASLHPTLRAAGNS